MNKKDLINAIAEKTGFTKKDVTVVVEEAINAMSEALTSGEDVSLFGFGKFVVVAKPESTGRNPQTGDEIIIPAHNVVKFKVSETLKNAVK